MIIVHLVMAALVILSGSVPHTVRIVHSVVVAIQYTSNIDLQYCDTQAGLLSFLE